MTNYNNALSFNNLLSNLESIGSVICFTLFVNMISYFIIFIYLLLGPPYIVGNLQK